MHNTQWIFNKTIYGNTWCKAWIIWFIRLGLHQIYHTIWINTPVAALWSTEKAQAAVASAVLTDDWDKKNEGSYDDSHVVVFWFNSMDDAYNKLNNCCINLALLTPLIIVIDYVFPYSYRFAHVKFACRRFWIM